MTGDVFTPIRATFGDLALDGARFASPLRPSQGSALAADDAASPVLTLQMSQLTRVLLATAWDHFTLVQLTIEQGRMYVTATGSVLRGALVAAAQAVWILGPDDPAVRRERNFMLAEEWLKNRIRYQEHIAQRVDAAQQAASATQLVRIREDLARIAALRTTKAQFETTDIVRKAGELCFADPDQRHTVVAEWRRLGGDAHALGWQLLTQEVTWGGQPDDTGLTPAAVTTDPIRVAEPYVAAWRMYRAGLRRLHQLSLSPSA